MNTSAHHHYNPDWLSDDALLANFVARQNEFAFLRDELAHAPLSGNIQHYLLVGVRGAGKTTLLKRLAVAIRRDEDLSNHLIALSFPEELYQVKNLADFWWAACDALVDELDTLGLEPAADHLLAAAKRGRHAGNKNDPASDAGFTLLQQTCAKLQRRPVLLVDNLDMVFQRIDKTGRKLNDPHAPAYWALREALSTSNSPIVIGGSVRLSTPFTDYDKAFYDFFLPKRLGKLSLDEAREVLERLSEAQSLPDVKQRLRARPGRIEALFELTGGNPRALGLIFELLRSGANSRAVEDFERLMDLTTPYYKARIEDLSEQAQVVMHALAVNNSGEGLRFGHTAAELGAHAGLATTSVSAQLTILENEGLVEKSAAHGRTQYRIAEQLFRLWLQMRGTRRIRQNVIGLTKFFEAMYDPDELHEKLKDPCGASALSEAKYAFAIAATRTATAQQRADLEAFGKDRLHTYLTTSGDKFEDYLPDSAIPPDVTQDDAEDASNQAMSAEWLETGLSAEEDGRLEEAEFAFRQAIAHAPNNTLLQFRLGSLLIDMESRQEEAEKAFRTAIDINPTDVRGWLSLGILLAKNLSRHDEAESAYRKAIELDPDLAVSWIALGLLLSGDSERHGEAENSYRRAIELDQANWMAWDQLGGLLETLDRNEESLSSFEKAVELKPNVNSLLMIGIVLGRKLHRFSEAEIAVRKAIALDPDDAQAWALLASLLAIGFQRYDDAKAALRTAIDLDTNNAELWFILGTVYASSASSYKEAEVAFRHAIELDPSHVESWHGLGNLLADKLQRPLEAEEAYRKSIELDPGYALPFFNLGQLYEASQRNELALASYQQAAALDSNLDSPWQTKRSDLRARIGAAHAREALDSGDQPTLRGALSDLLASSSDIAATLVSEEFIEKFLAPLLENSRHASMALDAMRDAGYEKHARPLLLAFEAAIHGREAMLDELEPELQGATKRIFERLRIDPASEASEGQAA